MKKFACLAVLSPLFFAAAAFGAGYSGPIQQNSAMYNSCTHESMLLTLTGRLTLTTNGTANNTQASSHLELHGTAVGQISKDRYIINDIFNCMQNVGTSGVPFETTQTIVLNVIGQGKTPNFTIKSLARLTVNAKGEVAASLNDFSFICK